MPYLVWVDGLRGPELQIWHDNPPIGGGKRSVLQGPIEIRQIEVRMRLSKLALKYPYIEKGSLS